jgi:hypothetical protein
MVDAPLDEVAGAILVLMMRALDCDAWRLWMAAHTFATVVIAVIWDSIS